jgi:hypothetical protein
MITRAPPPAETDEWERLAAAEVAVLSIANAGASNPRDFSGRLESLASIASVTHLDLSHCRGLRDAAAARVAARCGPALRWLSVAGTHGAFSSTGLAAFPANCPNLEYVDCSGASNFVDGARAEAQLLHACTAAKSVRAHASTDALAALSSSAVELTHLALESRGLRMRIPMNAAAMPATFFARLRSLDLSGVQVTDTDLRLIAQHCGLLTGLRLGPTARPSDAAMIHVARRNHSLTDIAVGPVASLSDASILALVEYCSGLRAVELGPSTASDASLIALGARCPGLTRLDASGAAGVTDAGVKAVATGCPRLRQLRLVGCTAVTQDALVAIARGCSGLLAMELKCRTPDGLDAAVTAIAESCRCLRTLVAQGSPVSVHALEALASNSHQLSSVDASCESPAATSPAVVALRRKCHSVTV